MTLYSLDILLFLFGTSLLFHVQVKLLLPNVHTDFSRGRSGNLLHGANLAIHHFIWGDSGNSVRLYFWGAPKSLQMVIAAMKLKDAYSLEGKL